MKLLLHVCCGPCSLEPYRMLSEDYDVTLYYSNDNIYPESEFYKRQKELVKCTDKVVYDTYDHKLWKRSVKNRCSDCYKLRLKKSAEYAADHGFTHLSTSLAVSPYQQTETIKNTLNEISKQYNLKPVFIDFRPYYREATKHSIELDMYRQKYCGCEYSLKEREEQVKQKEQNKLKQHQLQKEAKERKSKIKAKQDRKRRLKEKYKTTLKNKQNCKLCGTFLD